MDVLAVQVQPDQDAQPIYSEEDVVRKTATFANPYLSLLPANAEPDWAYWQARMRFEQQQKQTSKSASSVSLIVDELEPRDTSGVNDQQELAELIGQLGTGAADTPQALVSGILYAPPPQVLGPFFEDDGSIPLANETGLTAGNRVRFSTEIGNGPYGSQGASSGDFDAYKISDAQAGQMLIVDITTPDDPERLDSKAAVFSVEGIILEESDNEDATTPDPYLEFVIPETGDYYVFVRGVNSAWPGDAYNSASGPKAGSEGPYTITMSLDAQDHDYYSFDLEEGDVVGVNLRGTAKRVSLFDPSGLALMSSAQEIGYLMPTTSPLPQGGRANVAHVADHAGRYALSVAQGEGAYDLDLWLFRPALEGSDDEVQTLFLDFDGVTFNAESLFGGHPTATLSPLTAFLQPLGLDPTPGGADENALIDAVLATVQNKLVEDVANRGGSDRFQLEVRNSRDHEDDFGDPFVSRVIVGGTRDEFGVSTVATAQSVDVGNFVTNETAVVLLDLLSTPGNPNSLHQFTLAPGRSLIDFYGWAIGLIVAHEAGHLFANFHTEPTHDVPNIMEPGIRFDEFIGIGEDDVWGSVDDKDVSFGEAPFRAAEMFSGALDTRSAIAFGLVGPEPIVSIERFTDEEPSLFELGQPYPNPANSYTRIFLSLQQAHHISVHLYDVLGRRVRTIYDGLAQAHSRTSLELNLVDLPSGVYYIRTTGAGQVVTRPLVIAK